jgi:hypothetical protein
MRPALGFGFRVAALLRSSTTLVAQRHTIGDGGIAPKTIQLS